MDDHRVTAVDGGVRLGFRCLDCGTETELFKPYQPDADAPATVATPNGANGNGDPAGAKARQNGSKRRKRGWDNGIQYGRAKKVRAGVGRRAEG
jgi:hypothetical protein